MLILPRLGYIGGGPTGNPGTGAINIETEICFKISTIGDTVQKVMVQAKLLQNKNI